MGGPENIKGFDYQISYCLLRTLEILSSTNSAHSLLFESLDEEEEDFNILGADFNEYHQLKKRIEGNHWTLGDMREILKKFVIKDKGATKYYFVTDGTANPEVRKLKLALDSHEEIDDTLLKTFVPTGETIENIRKVFERTTILTRFYASDDDKDPAKNLKAKILDLLSRSPFEIKNSINTCYSSLWKIIFDYAREAQIISVDRIKIDFENSGLFIKQMQWIDTPNIGGFHGREVEVEAILQELKKSNKLIIYGINGIGKTWITTKIITEIIPDFTCWIKVDRWTSINHIIFLIASLLYSKGHSYEAKQLQGLEIADRIPVIVSILEKINIVIVFDSINSGNIDIKTFIDNLIDYSLDKKFIGSVIVTSTKKLNSYTDIDIQQNKISQYHLSGFTLSDTVVILDKLEYRLSEEEIGTFQKELGGHPMSIFFLTKLIANKSVSSDELSSIGSLTLETTRDWIIEKSIMQLPDEDKEHLFRLSLLDGEILDDEIDFILEANTKPKYLLSNLSSNHLVSYHNGKLSIHDSIVEVSRSLLKPNFKSKIHEKLVSFYFEKMQAEHAKEDGISYEIILKWGNHIEQLHDSNLMEEKYARLLKLSNDQLAALGAINRFGYPFDFETEDLSSSEYIVRELVEKGFVEKNTDPEKKYMYAQVEFSVTNLDFWQTCFITHLCLSRDLPYDMGYVQIFEPNYSWHLQHASCWWEHCIEFMPLPPLSKAQRIEHQEFIKEQKTKGLLGNSWEEIDDGLGEIDDEVDLEMVESRCPMWGHCCPDGKEQAAECKQMFESDDN